MNSFPKQIKSFLEKERNDLRVKLSRFAEENKRIKGDWKTRFPKAGNEKSEDALEDAAKKREEYERDLPVEYLLETKLKSIERALEKFEKGKYGICEKCGKKISEARLEAIPEAQLCIKCKINEK